MARRNRPAEARHTIAETLRARRDVLFDLEAGLPRLVELDVAEIVPNPHQPRRNVDDGTLDELAASIDRHGLLQPIVVSRAETGYVLVAGQRRWLAHRRLGRTRIAALLTDGAIDELALIENLQREDLDPLDESAALAALKERHGYTLEQLAQTLAKAKSTISELLSLTRLAGPLLDEIRTARPAPSKSVLVELARIEGEDARLAWWRQFREGPKRTVRAARSQRARGGVEAEADDEGAARLKSSSQRFLHRLEAAPASVIKGDADLLALLRALHARLGALVAD